jgi:hypothetical protein
MLSDIKGKTLVSGVSSEFRGRIHAKMPLLICCWSQIVVNCEYDRFALTL